MFDNFILTDGLFAKALWSLKTCSLVKIYRFTVLLVKVLPLESRIAFGEGFKVTLVPFFVSNFSLLNCELDNFKFKCYIELFCADIILRGNNITILKVPCEKSKMTCFISSIMKNIVVFPSRSRFPVKSSCFILSKSASSACSKPPVV